jgi:membrane-anchored protein YejM (alkaline phosphatase superfamily)
LRDETYFLLYALLLLEGAAAALILLGALVARWVHPGLLVSIVAFVFAAILAGIFLDTKVYVWVGRHSYSPAVIEAILQPDALNVVHINRRELLTLFAGGGLLAGLELAAARACSWWWVTLAPPRQSRVAALLVGAHCAALLACTFAVAGGPPKEREALAEILPLYGPLFEDPSIVRFRSTLRRPDYPKHRPDSCILQRRPNILFVAVESLRSDALNEELMPNMQHFAAAHQCIRSRHHHSGSHVSELGFFSLLYGLDTYYLADFSHYKAASYPLELLKHNGYTVAGACSAHMSRWGYSKLVTDQFAPYQEFYAEQPFQRDKQMLDWAEKTYRARDSAQPLFLFLFFDATHHDYSYPTEFERFKPVFPQGSDLLFADDTAAEVRQQIQNRYRNSVLYVDSLVGHLLQVVRDDWLKGELLIVLTGDHAEEFWDEGSWGHMQPRFINARTQVPLVMCLPDRQLAELTLSSHADILPTLLDYLGTVPPLKPFDYSDGVSLLAPPQADRHVVVNTAGMGWYSHTFQLITPLHKFSMLRRSDAAGQASYVAQRMTDLDDRPVSETEEVAQELQRHVARFKETYERFYAR